MTSPNERITLECDVHHPPSPQPSKTLTNVQIENQKWLFVSPLSLIFVGEIEKESVWKKKVKSWAIYMKELYLNLIKKNSM